MYLQHKTTKRFTPQGDEALTIVSQLRRDIESAWETLRRNVLAGMTIDAALLLFMQIIRDLLRAAYAAVWRIGRGDDFQGEQEFSNIEGLISADAAEMETYLQTVDQEAARLPDDDERLSLLARRLSRVVYYAGGAWTMFNIAKTHGKPAGDLWQWSGPVDERTCRICREEMARGPRPLAEILQYPGRDSICAKN